jgi:hypothetical protein
LDGCLFVKCFLHMVPSLYTPIHTHTPEPTTKTQTTGNGGAKAVASLLQHTPLLEDLRFSGARAQSEGSLVRVRACVRACVDV